MFDLEYTFFCKKFCRQAAVNSKVGQNGNKEDALSDLVIRRKFIEHAEQAPELTATAVDGMGVHDGWMNVAAEHTSSPGRLSAPKPLVAGLSLKIASQSLSWKKQGEGSHSRENLHYQQRVQEE